jgi:hypothetical protein
MNYKLRRFAAPMLALALLASAPLSGCKSTLEPGGAYAPTTTDAQGVVTASQAPDKAFYIVDSTFALAYDTIQSVFKYERDNRVALFQISPDIKHSLDSIRPAVTDGVRKYTEARAVYKANPTPAGLDALHAALAKIQQLTTTATAVLPK